MRFIILSIIALAMVGCGGDSQTMLITSDDNGTGFIETNATAEDIVETYNISSVTVDSDGIFFVCANDSECSVVVDESSTDNSIDNSDNSVDDNSDNSIDNTNNSVDNTDSNQTD